MVVIFTDGSIGNIQGLYLLLSRSDIQIDGIVVDSGICPLDIGMGNVLQLLMYMGKYSIHVYKGTEWESFIPNSTELELCSTLDIYPLSGGYDIPSHTELMCKYNGDIIVLGPYASVAEWIENGSVTSLTGFLGSIYPSDLGYYIYAIDPQAYNYVMMSSVEKTLIDVDSIHQQLSDAVRGIVISSTVLRTLSESVMSIIIDGKWKFWDMITVMKYLNYIL
jgi:hypothetical protein